MHFDPHFEEVRGGVEPWWMARWKALAKFLLSIFELLFYLLWLRRYKAKRVKTRSLQEWVGHFEAKFQGEGVVPGEYFLVPTKLDTFCYPTVQTAPCCVPACRRFDTIPACDGRTDCVLTLLMANVRTRNYRRDKLAVIIDIRVSQAV